MVSGLSFFSSLFSGWTVLGLTVSMLINGSVVEVAVEIAEVDEVNVCWDRKTRCLDSQEMVVDV